MVKFHRNIGMLALCIFFTPLMYAQQGLLQKIQLNDFYRRGQITGMDSINNSFCVTPYTPKLNYNSYTARKDSFYLTSSFGYTLQNNSKLPYSYNDESLYPASGFQQRFTVGVQLDTRNFTIRLQPEWVSAANVIHDDLIPPPSNDLNNFWGRYFAMLANRSDVPSRFGDKAISKVFPGQSSVRYKISKFSIGVSTENLWWGPTRYNALIMSNNAPGFLHATLNTTEPIQTPIGSLEAQFIYGALNGSGVRPPEYSRIEQLGCGICYEPPVETKTRNVAGYVFTLSPKGLRNFFIGMSYSSYRYADTNLKASGLGSIFFRYVMPKDNAEIYAEYGRSDKHISPFDLFKDTVPYGYTIGFRKMVPLRNNKSHISIAAELTHLGLSKAKLIFNRDVWGPPNPNSYSWYTSATIRHGYTNYGQIMGVGIGTGSNSQTLNISWVSSQNIIGLQLQRVMRNTDFYYYNYFNGFFGNGYTHMFWVDLSASLYAQWQYKNFIFAGSVDNLNSFNYKWLKLDGGFEGASPLSDKRNFQARLSVLYSVDWMKLRRSN